jgi:hypothetical protein
MHGLHQNAEIVRLDIRGDAMTQVEYMPRSATVTCEDVRNTLFDYVGRLP